MPRVHNSLYWSMHGNKLWYGVFTTSKFWGCTYFPKQFFSYWAPLESTFPFLQTQSSAHNLICEKLISKSHALVSFIPALSPFICKGLPTSSWDSNYHGISIYGGWLTGVSINTFMTNASVDCKIMGMMHILEFSNMQKLGCHYNSNACTSMGCVNSSGPNSL